MRTLDNNDHSYIAHDRRLFQQLNTLDVYTRI